MAKYTVDSIAKGLKAAAKAFNSEVTAKQEPRRYAAGNKPITCVHCGGGLFNKDRISIGYSTVFADEMAIGVDGHRAHALACVTCGRIELFTGEPSEILA